MNDKKKTGRLGEELASQFLLNKGYKILQRNWRFSRAEVDIIAKHGDILVFVEVKTRSSNKMGEPEDFVSMRQMEMLVQAAPAYMEEIDFEGEIRFDVIGVLISGTEQHVINHYEDAWFPEMND